MVNSSNLIDVSSLSESSIPRISSPASLLEPNQRIDLALQALTRKSSVSDLSRQARVSRKFIYQQADTARQVLDQAFSSKDSEADKEILFYLPVTKAWLRQFVLAQLLICHAPYRGVIEILADLFDTDLSIGTIHNIAHEAVEKARLINAKQDLSRVEIGAHDEIFQSGLPVLVGVDVESTYCYLLALEQHRDAVTWGVHLLDLSDQGLHPHHTIADGGLGLRAGQTLAWPEIPCFSDLFHASRDFGQLVTFLDNRALSKMSSLETLEHKMEKAKRKGQGNTFSKKLALARSDEAAAISLADDVRTLEMWLRQDVLAVAGPDYQTRCELFDFILEELKSREALCPHRIEPVRRSLENQRKDLLAFAELLDQRIRDLAVHFQVSPEFVREMLALQEMAMTSCVYWQRESKLRGVLQDRFEPLQQEVCKLRKKVVRASSIVENLNSRLRNYFFLRKSLGSDYLELLRFFLNHHRFERSERPERVGKSPSELLSGQPHPHWLEMLGFERFHRSN